MFSNIEKARSEALRKAQKFCSTSQSLPLLGWGVSGFVFLSLDLRTAIKVHHTREAFNTELSAYRILKQHNLMMLHGLTIPVLRHFDLSLHLIEIDFVRPPYLLDFAGVKFRDPEFSADTMTSIHADIEERFGHRSDIAYAVYHDLRRLGIYYLDLRQSNLNLEGLPEV